MHGSQGRAPRSSRQGRYPHEWPKKQWHQQIVTIDVGRAFLLVVWISICTADRHLTYFHMMLASNNISMAKLNLASDSSSLIEANVRWEVESKKKPKMGAVREPVVLVPLDMHRPPSGFTFSSRASTSRFQRTCVDRENESRRTTLLLRRKISA